MAKKTSSAERLYNANLSQSDSDIAPDMARGSGKVMRRVDFSNEKTGPNFDVPHRASRIDNSDGSRVGPDMGKVNKPTKAKPSIKALKDTSSNYWSADGLSGDIGSASGETGANMGQVNKGGYDASADGMKRGGKVSNKSFGFTASKDMLKQHSAGHKHNSEHTSKHAAGFKPFHEHVMTMCKGGKTK